MRQDRPYLSVLTAMGLIAGCGGDAPTATPRVATVASVVVEPPTALLSVGRTIQLAATPKDSVGGTLVGRAVAWASDNPDVAEVSASGVVTARGIGAARVTATIEGKSASAQVTVEPSTFTSLAAGPASEHTCAVRTGGAIYCWGNNSDGQLGDGTNTNRATPTRVQMPAGLGFMTLAPGYQHSCGLTGELIAYCWGLGRRLGDGGTTDRSAPTARVQTPSGQEFLTLSAGNAHTCSTTHPGTAFCWGYNGSGQLGDGTTEHRLAATAVRMPPEVNSGVGFSAVSAGDSSTCAAGTNGKVYCWGSNSWGQLGDGTTTDRLVPTAVQMPAGVSFSAVRVGGAHACALTTSGTAYCWGGNGNGQLGNGTGGGNTQSRQTTPTPVQMPSGVTFTQLVAGSGHTCGLAATGTAYCWGFNGLGQVGNGSTSIDVTLPTQVQTPTGVSFSSLTAGALHTCGLTAGGLAYCWGGNAKGQLGDGTTTMRLVPTPVALP